MTVTTDADGLLLDGSPMMLWAGELHHWRVDPSDWAVVLDAVRDLGFRTV